MKCVIAYMVPVVTGGLVVCVRRDGREPGVRHNVRRARSVKTVQRPVAAKMGRAVALKTAGVTARPAGTDRTAAEPVPKAGTVGGAGRFAAVRTTPPVTTWTTAVRVCHRGEGGTVTNFTSLKLHR